MPDDILRTPITRSQLAAQLRSLGLRPGSVVEVHRSLSSLGFVVGGADAVVLGFLEAVDSGGSHLALSGCDQDSFGLEGAVVPLSCHRSRALLIDVDGEPLWS